MKFEEGKYYEFQVIKVVNLPEEGNFYLLRHTSGRRLMLPFDTYKNYSISPDSRIECRVDKVSCTGRVYLEPRHPKYSEGEIYNFKVVNVISENNIVELEDIFGNIIVQEIPSNEIIFFDTIELRVLRIKKGIPKLAFPNDYLNRVTPQNLIGTYKEFIIKYIKRNYDNEEVYILETNDGYKSHLKVKHYKHYSLNINDKILCEVYGFKENGLLKVEPQNPYYKVGGVYNFELVEFEGLRNDFESFEEILIVKDYFGNKCGISINLDEFASINKKTRVLGRVIGFRKGKPKLEIIIDKNH